MSERSPGDPPSPDRAGIDGIAEQIGGDPDLLRKLWLALGFTEEAADMTALSAAETEAAKVFVTAGDVMDEDALIAAARVVGQAMSRLADWEAEQLLRLREDLGDQIPADYLVEALSQVQTMIWQRHLRDAMAREVDAVPEHETELVAGFADLVGYTALSRRLSLSQLAELLDVFEERAYAVITEHDGRVVKTLGDAVMFTTPDPVAAALIALDLQEIDRADDGDSLLPPLRIGLARGSVLQRAGDVYGEPVNIAARLVGLARSGTILVDTRVAEMLETDPRFRLKRIPPHAVRGYRRLPAFALGADRHWQQADDTGEAAAPEAGHGSG